MSELENLSDLIRQRNEVDRHIASLIGRPAHAGHIGEYIAARIFDIDLHASASTRATDGVFQSGSLAGKSVNIKYGTRRDGMLNLSTSLDALQHADVYLVMTGPAVGAISSKGLEAPLVIHAVYCFLSGELLDRLVKANRRPGIATSLRRDVWERAMVYPEPNSTLITLSDHQRIQLALFRGENET